MADGYIATNKETGEKAWWDGEKLTPIAEMEKAQVGKLNELEQSTQRYKSALESNQAPPAESMKLSDFTQERQRSAVDEAQRGLAPLKRATIPTAAAAATMIPGVGPFLGAGIQAGGTALNQVIGQEPYSLGEIAKSAALPLVGGAIVKGLKGTLKGVGEFFTPSAARKAGTEAAVESMGGSPNVINRAYSTPASDAAYKAVAAQGPVPLTAINRTITDTWDNLTNLSNAPPRAVKYLENLSNKYAGKTQANYDDLKDEMQMLRQNAEKAFKQKDIPTGRAMMDARSKILDEMDKISPALSKANAHYRREQSIEQVSKVLSNPRPDVKLGELLLRDPLVQGAIPKGEAKFLENIADQITRIGTQGSPYSGVTAKFVNFISKPVAAAMLTEPGRYMLRQTFKKDGVTAAGLATVAQFMRAYEAQEAE